MRQSPVQKEGKENYLFLLADTRFLTGPSFHVPGVAPTVFIASLAEYLVPEGLDVGSFAWFKPPPGFARRFHAKAAFNGTVQKFEPPL
jgi:hypothetical protein